jgi:flagellar hook-associated protein 2
MTIQLGGLASGLDVNALVTGLVNASREPLTRVQTKQREVDQAAQTLTTLSSKLSALQQAATALATPSEFASFSATSTDGAVVASTFGAPTPGRYDVTVSQLAREQKTFSDPQASSTGPLGMSGSLDLTIGGTTSSVAVSAADSLTDIAAKISVSGARVSASVLFDGTTYRLQVRGLDTGAANGITFAENGFALGLGTPANTKQASQDAALTVDGIAITRPTNAVQGVVPGVTFALTKTTTSPVTVDVKTDPTALQQKLQKFVDAYNDVVRTGQQASGFGSQKAQNKQLSGDSAVRSVLGRLSTLVTGPITGTTGAYGTLASVGIKSTRDGMLSLDAAKVTEALGADPRAVAKVFVLDPSAQSTGVMDSVRGAIDAMVGSASGLVQSRIEGFQSRSRQLADDATRLQTQLEAYEARLRKQFEATDVAASRYQAFGAALASMPAVGIYGNNSSG